MFTLEQRLKQASDIILEIHLDVDVGKLECKEYHIGVIEGIESRVTGMKYAIIAEVNKSLLSK